MIVLVFRRWITSLGPIGPVHDKGPDQLIKHVRDGDCIDTFGAGGYPIGAARS